MVYVDEVGIDQFMYRPYARALRGEKVFGQISGRKYQRVGIVAGQCDKKILAPLAYSGTCDHVLFEHWFEHCLLKELLPGQTIVMDNAAFHRKAVLRGLAEKANCSILFLPPYSPDLNPIENFWAWLKQILRSSLAAFDSFDNALLTCFQLV